jgi:integrase
LPLIPVENSSRHCSFASGSTVSEFLTRWQRDWATPNVSTKTFETYAAHLKQVRKHLGATRLQKLRPVHLTELYAKLLREDRGEGRGGLTARTVGHIHRVMHRALGHAMQWGLTAANAAEVIEPPRVASTEIEILRAPEIALILDKLRGRPIYPIVALALATGARRGELLALRWSDVDLEHARLRIERSIEQTVANGLVFKSPKTKHGRRSITLPVSAIAELRSHWKAQQEERLRIGLGKAGVDALVFSRWDNKLGEFTTRSPNGLSQEWLTFTREIGLVATFHSLRHSHASALIAAGLDVLTISRRLGHGSPTITLEAYGHLFSNTDDRAAEIMEAAFAKARTERER